MTVPAGEIDAAHAARLRDAARVDAHRFGARVAALDRARCAPVGFGPPRTETYATRESAEMAAAIGSTPSGIVLNERAGLGVEHGERIVRGKRNDDEALAARAVARRDGRRTGHEVAERAGVELPRRGIAGDIRFECAHVRHRGATPGCPRRGGEAADIRGDHPIRCPIYCQRVDAGASIDAAPGQRVVSAPIESKDAAGNGDPHFVRRRAEANATDFPLEDALDSGRRDALPGGDRAGIGDVTLRSLLGRTGQCGGDRECDAQHVVRTYWQRAAALPSTQNRRRLVTRDTRPVRERSRRRSLAGSGVQTFRLPRRMIEDHSGAWRCGCRAWKCEADGGRPRTITTVCRLAARRPCS